MLIAPLGIPRLLPEPAHKGRAVARGGVLGSFSLFSTGASPSGGSFRVETAKACLKNLDPCRAFFEHGSLYNVQEARIPPAGNAGKGHQLSGTMFRKSRKRK